MIRWRVAAVPSIVGLFLRARQLDAELEVILVCLSPDPDVHERIEALARRQGIRLERIEGEPSTEQEEIRS